MRYSYATKEGTATLLSGGLSKTMWENIGLAWAKLMYMTKNMTS
jgi:hypothetical protein